MRENKANAKFEKRKAWQGLQTSVEHTEADDAMVQVFGEEVAEEKASIDVENLPIPEKEWIIQWGFYFIGGFFLLVMIDRVVTVQLFQGMGLLILVILSFWKGRRIRYSSYREEVVLALANLAIVLKSVLLRYQTPSILINVSEKLLMYSIVFLGVEQIFFDWWSLGSLVYGFLYYTVIFSIVMVFSKKKSKTIYHAFFLLTLIEMIHMAEQALFFNSVNLFTGVSILVAWYLAGYFKSIVWNLKELKDLVTQQKGE